MDVAAKLNGMSLKGARDFCLSGVPNWSFQKCSFEASFRHLYFELNEAHTDDGTFQEQPFTIDNRAFVFTRDNFFTRI